jgi:hypothetical protein
MSIKRLKKPTKKAMAKPQVLYPVCYSDEERWDMVNRIVGHLNSCIDPLTKKIPYNCKPAWQPTVNSFTSDNWWDMIEGFDEVFTHTPYMTETQYRALQDAAYILREHPNHPRVLNEGKYKTVAWKALMSIREVYNEITGWRHNPNAQRSSSNYSNLFE